MFFIRTFLFVFCFLSGGITYAQYYDSLQLVYKEILRYDTTQKIVYTDRVGEGAYEIAKRVIDEPCCFVRASDSNFRFNGQERDAILAHLKQATRVRWSDSLFSKSRMIPFDSFHQYYKSLNAAKLRILPLLDTPGYSTEFRQAIGKEIRYRHWVFTFSRPIYLRNNTMAVLFMEARCGNDCGNNRLIVYRKEGNEWLKMAYVFDGAY